MLKKPVKPNFGSKNMDVAQLPYSAKLEQAILARILYDSDVIDAVYKYINIDGFFYDELNIALWSAINTEYKKGEYISVATISETIRVSGNVPLSQYVMALAVMDECFISVNQLISICLKCTEYAIRRNVNRISGHLYFNSTKLESDALDVLGEASDGISSIYAHIAQIRESGMKEATTELFEVLAKIQANRDIGIPSSIKALNSQIKGYRNGNLIVIAASTGEGKTTLAWQEAVSMAKSGNAIGYVSLEMSMSELLLISLSDETKIGINRIVSNEVYGNDLNRLSDCISGFKSLPIKFSDKAGLKVGEIKAIARTWKKTDDIKALFIDHLHLAYDDIDHSNNTEQRFTNIANKLKELAKELNIPVIALAQLSRKDKSEKTRKHIISDIKYAGGIEQAADVVLLLYRPAIHGVPDKDFSEAQIIVGKLRLMERNDVDCKFTGTSFIDSAPTYDNKSPDDDLMPF